MNEKQLIESKSDMAFSRHRLTGKNAKDAVMANDSAMLNPCAKKEKKPTLEEQFSDNGWKIIKR